MLRLLVIDDEAFYRSAVQDLLKGEDFDLRLSRSPGEALEELTRSFFDLLICDHLMPEMNGLDLLAHARKSCSVPAVLMAVSLDEVAESRMNKLGSISFLRKPFQKNELLKAIQGAQEISIERNLILGPDAKMSAVAIGIFANGRQLKCPVYWKSQNGRFLRFQQLARAGEFLSAEVIAGFKRRGLDFLFLREEDYQRHQSELSTAGE